MDRDALRIIDAAYNRAREAARMVEDAARFGWDDAGAAEAAKRLRHALREIMQACGAADLLRERDIVSDVGRDAKTAAELTRGGLEDVVGAAFARLSEALRTLSEFAKLVSADAGRQAEQLRYAGYALEQRLLLRARRTRVLRASGVYVLLTEALCAQPWRQTAEAVLDAGVRVVQLREKALSDRELLGRARWLRAATRAHDALLIINDRPDIARLCGADGVHVGQDDLSVAEVRRIGGGHLLVGKSSHTPEQFDAALAEAPDYVALGPMVQSTTKPQDHIAGVETLRRCGPPAAVPVVAIGGITAANAAQIVAAGADVLCVCSAVIAAGDAGAAAAQLLALRPARDAGREDGTA